MRGTRRERKRFMGTIRKQMLEVLLEGPVDGPELSRKLHIREKEVYEHLPHVARSAAALDMHFVIHPSRCDTCGFVFRDRRRVTPPGRCPGCKSTHLRLPTYELVPIH